MTCISDGTDGVGDSLRNCYSWNKIDSSSLKKQTRVIDMTHDYDIMRWRLRRIFASLVIY